MGYKEDYDYALRHLYDINLSLAHLFLEQAPVVMDRECAADLLVVEWDKRQLGCRVRRPGYEARYPLEFTIRSHRDSGAKTELAKIEEGFCDAMFYGHVLQAKEMGRSFSRWWYVDLSVFREHYPRVDKHRLEWKQKANGDGTYFLPVDVTDYPADLVIASSHPVPGRERVHVDPPARKGPVQMDLFK